LSPTSPTFGNFIGFQLENVAAGAAGEQLQIVEEQLQIADASTSDDEDGPKLPRRRRRRQSVARLVHTVSSDDSSESDEEVSILTKKKESKSKLVPFTFLFNYF
jgi:hypothetical protein